MSPITALVAEDEPLLQAELADALHGFGCPVVCSALAAAAFSGSVAACKGCW